MILHSRVEALKNALTPPRVPAQRFDARQAIGQFAMHPCDSGSGAVGVRADLHVHMTVPMGRALDVSVVYRLANSSRLQRIPDDQSEPNSR